MSVPTVAGVYISSVKGRWEECQKRRQKGRWKGHCWKRRWEEGGKRQKVPNVLLISPVL